MISLRTLLHARSTDALQGTWLPVRMTAVLRTFGWLLLLLGLATVPVERMRLRALYVTVWFLIAFVSYVPWEHISGLLA